MTESIAFVSIVVPTRNRRRLLRECLNTLLAQDYPPTYYEIIVAEDGSTGETQLVVEDIASFPRPGPRVIYVGVPRWSANAARNAGIRASSGGIIVFCDDDITAPIGWLRALVAPVAADDVEATVGPVVLKDSTALPGKHPAELAALVTHVAAPEVLLACNMAVRREVFGRGLFDPDVQAPVEETEWMARVRPRWRMVPEAAVVHAKDPASLRFWPLLRVAWHRGLAGGAYGSRRGRREVAPALATAARAVGHAARSRCAGGLIIAVASAGRAVGALRD